MSKAFTGLSTGKLNKVARAAAVQRALRNKAERTLPRTRALAYSAGATEFARALRVTDGVRPGLRARGGFQRPYARVSASMTEAQRKRDAGAKMSRRMILRRGSNA